jgi:hypothetical protein
VGEFVDGNSGQAEPDLLAGAPVQSLPTQPEQTGLAQLSGREQELVGLVAKGRTERRSPGRCISASARSARTWTGSGIRPGTGAALT